MDNFIQVLGAAMGFYNRSLSEAEAALWLALLDSEGITATEAIGALQAHLKNPNKGQYAPKPSDLIGQLRGTEKNHELEAAAAYGEVMGSIRRFGAYRSVVFSNHAINVAIRSMGGWVSMCHSEEPDGVRRAAWAKCYVAAKAGIGSVELPLLGLCGLDYVEYIGDAAAAKALVSHSSQTKLPSITIKSIGGSNAYEQTKG